MLRAGNFLWNAGIFLFSAKTILDSFKAHAPELVAPVADAVELSHTDLGFLRLEPKSWACADNISIDYAVMERAKNLSVVPYAAGWSDLGDWDAVWREAAHDGSGVVTSGPATALDCEDTLLRSEDVGLEIVGIGLRNIIAIAMPDAVLVADASKAQEVKLAVAALKAKSATQAESLPRDYRPWGWYESIAVGARFQVKQIVVNPGAALHFNHTIIVLSIGLWLRGLQRSQ